MVRIGVLLVLFVGLTCTACRWEPAKPEQDAVRPWTPPNGGRGESDPDTLEHLMAVQQYSHEHGGRLPPPDAHLDR